MSAVAHWLVIDDDDSFRAVLARALQRRGYSVATAADALSALAVARQGPIDQVVLDLKLGKDNGLDLIAPLLMLQPTLKIVVLTGYASISTAVEAIRRGAWNYLCKPVDAEALITAFTAAVAPPVPPQADIPMSLRRLQWEHIQRILAEHDGNISAAARTLGMHRRTLQRRLSKRPVSD